jgi:hypothetical protein
LKDCAFRTKMMCGKLTLLAYVAGVLLELANITGRDNAVH